MPLVWCGVALLGYYYSSPDGCFVCDDGGEFLEVCLHQVLGYYSGLAGDACMTSVSRVNDSIELVFS
jgi:hypothetical protein